MAKQIKKAAKKVAVKKKSVNAKASKTPAKKVAKKVVVKKAAKKEDYLEGRKLIDFTTNLKFIEETIDAIITRITGTGTPNTCPCPIHANFS